MAGPRGRRSVMEPTAGYTARSAPGHGFGCLSDVFRCFLTGSCSAHSPADVAAAIVSGLCGGDPAPVETCYDGVDLTCISLSLVDKMSSGVTSQSLSPSVSLYCVDILRVLFQHTDLMSKLVHLFQAEDQIISHLSAKTTSSCVFYHLHQSGTISPVWQQTCVQAFLSSPPGTKLDACLTSLTEVLKRLLKGAHHDILGKLLAVFDSSLSALCSKFLPEERKEAKQCYRQRGTTFYLLLDLLEVLTASSFICGSGVCLKSQRITHIQSSVLLRAISCSSEYFAKKRVLLLLKRAVLQKAGEDWALGEVPFTELKYEHFNSDISMLAQSVLTAVAAKWLQSVQVKSTSFFAGTRHIRGDEGQNPDCVMLRAVSLLLLKSMELCIQTRSGTVTVESDTEINGCLQSLWSFLKWYSVQLREATHLCCWVSLLFGDQDDDMMESAKALLSIFLHCRQRSGLDESAMLEAACASGCNPHCHFLFLLHSISFDHSILLDFLISTETCFLEYFVRYLKYLRADWQGFIAACCRMSLSDHRLSRQQSLSTSCVGDLFALTYKEERDRVQFSSSVQPTGVISPVEMKRLGAGFHLVEYDSSEESDPENSGISQHQPETSVCENRRLNALRLKDEITEPPIPNSLEQYESFESTELLRGPNSTHERRSEMSSPLMSPREQTSCPTNEQMEQMTCETSARAVLCLSELREVVARLQTKKLFSYNPSSLLKLLAQVENCSHQSHFS